MDEVMIQVKTFFAVICGGFLAVVVVLGTLGAVFGPDETRASQSSQYDSDSPYTEHYPYVTPSVDIGTWARIAQAKAQRKEAHQRIERKAEAKRKAEAEQATEQGATSVPHVRHPRVWRHVRRHVPKVPNHLGNGRCDSCHIARRIWHFLH